MFAGGVVAESRAWIPELGINLAFRAVSEKHRPFPVLEVTYGAFDAEIERGEIAESTDVVEVGDGLSGSIKGTERP